MFIPTVIIGVIGGVLGSLFAIINLKVARTRKRILAHLSKPWKQSLLRLLEPAVIMVSCIVAFIIHLLLFNSFNCLFMFYFIILSQLHIGSY